MLEEVVNDKVVRMFFFLIENRVFVMLKKLRELIFVESLVYRVQVSYLLWDALLKYEINCGLNTGSVIEILLIIALQVHFWMRVFIH